MYQGCVPKEHALSNDLKRIPIFENKTQIMTKNEELFHKIAAAIPDTTEGKMFGALCIKALNGKAGVMFWREDMIFKLDGDMLDKALAIPGAKLFDPMGGRPMNGWVQVPNVHSAKWKKYALTAMSGVGKIDVSKKVKSKKAQPKG